MRPGEENLEDHADAGLPGPPAIQCLTCGAVIPLPTTAATVYWADARYWHRPCATSERACTGSGPKPGEMRRLRWLRSSAVIQT